MWLLLLFPLTVNKIKSAIKVIVIGLGQGLQGHQIGTTEDHQGMMSAKDVIILATIEAQAIVNTVIGGISAEVQNQVMNQGRTHTTGSPHQEVIMTDVSPTIVVMVVHVATIKATEMIIDKIKSQRSDVQS
jgi:cytochrome b